MKNSKRELKERIKELERDKLRLEVELEGCMGALKELESSGTADTIHKCKGLECASCEHLIYKDQISIRADGIEGQRRIIGCGRHEVKCKDWKGAVRLDSIQQTLKALIIEDAQDKALNAGEAQDEETNH